MRAFMFYATAKTNLPLSFHLLLQIAFSSVLLRNVLHVSNNEERLFMYALFSQYSDLRIDYERQTCYLSVFLE